MLSSTEIIKKATEHKERIGEDKATYIEGVLCGYFMAVEEIGYKDTRIAELEKEPKEANTFIALMCGKCAYKKDYTKENAK